MNKKISFLILIGAIVASPSLASAVTLGSMASAAVQSALLVASAAVVILWLVTGFLFLSASGSPEKLKSARTALFASVAGTVIVIVATGAINLVSNAFNL